MVKATAFDFVLIQTTTPPLVSPFNSSVFVSGPNVAVLLLINLYLHGWFTAVLSVDETVPSITLKYVSM